MIATDESKSLCTALCMRILNMEQALHGKDVSPKHEKLCFNVESDSASKSAPDSI